MLELATSEDIDKLARQIHHLERRITIMADATQADIDNLTQQVNQVNADLQTTRDKLQAEIDALDAQGVDVTALQAAVAPLDQAVNDLGNLQPTPPAPPAAG